MAELEAPVRFADPWRALVYGHDPDDIPGDPRRPNDEDTRHSFAVVILDPEHGELRRDTFATGERASLGPAGRSITAAVAVAVAVPANVPRPSTSPPTAPARRSYAGPRAVYSRPIRSSAAASGPAPRAGRPMPRSKPAGSAPASTTA